MRIHIEDAGEIRGTPIGNCTVQDVNVIRYDSGKIFVRFLYEDFLQKMAADMHRNVTEGNDNVVVVEGREGSGKSNLAWQICRAYDPEFDTTRQYIYSIDEFLENLGNDDEKTTYWLDESSNIANNRDWNTDHNKAFVQLLEMMRSRHWTLIMCIPHMERLDLYIRENRIRYLVKCYPMEFSKMGYKKRGFFELNKQPEQGDKLTTIGFGMYDPIPPEDKKIYEQQKLESQNKKIEEIKSKAKPGEKYKSKFEEKCKEENIAMLRLSNMGISDADLMAAFNINAKSTFLNRLSKAREY